MEEKLSNLTYGQSVVISVVVAAFYFLMFYDSGDSRRSQIGQLKNQLKLKNSKLEEIKVAVEKAEEYKEIVKQLGDQIEVIYTAIPSDLNGVQVRKIISTEARAVGLDIISIEEARDSYNRGGLGSDFINSIKVEARFEGHYSQLMLLMSNLTKIKKVIKINNLYIERKTGVDPKKKSADDSDNPILNFRATLYAYKYIGDKNEAGR